MTELIAVFPRMLGFLCLQLDLRHPQIEFLRPPGQVGFALLERGMLLPKLRLPFLDLALLH